MKNIVLHIVCGLLLVLLAGCGPAPAPTLAVADIQGTAFALASTGIAMTKAALPTATPLPPTATQSPSVTPFPSAFSLIPTLGLPGGSPTDNPCNLPAPFRPKGSQVAVIFKNETRGRVHLSFGMNAPNDLGECGTYDFYLGPFGTPTERVLTGCYWGYAAVEAAKSTKARNISDMCLTDGGHTYEVTIGTEVISLTG